ncbi:MAG: DUF3343 domain-containing protein [Syntrophaceae bacterium]
MAWFKRCTAVSAEVQAVDLGFLTFQNTSEVLRAQKVLSRAGWKIRVMGPPPEVRTGCDLVIEFPLMEEFRIVKTLADAGVKPENVVPVASPLLKPVDLYTITDFPEHLMVRAANMKITVDRHSLVIVNISGGGCPDVPFLAAAMTGKHLSKAPQPKDIGHTLCAYALQLAYEEMLKRCSP